MAWDRPFDDPVELPNGKIALTLKDAGDYITELSDAQYKHPTWQNAMRALEAAEDRGPILHAHIGMMQAIQKDIEPKFGPGKRVTVARQSGALPHIGAAAGFTNGSNKFIEWESQSTP